MRPTCWEVFRISVRSGFIRNDFDTRTRGADAVFAWQRDWDGGATSSGVLAWNWTALDLVDLAQPRQIDTFLGVPLKQPATLSLLTLACQVEMETLNPRHRVILTGRHESGPVCGMLRFNYYTSFQTCPLGNTLCAHADGQTALETYGATLIMAGELGWTLRRSYRIALGISNIFDTVPLVDPLETSSTGNAHPRALPWDYNGRALYARLTADLL